MGICCPANNNTTSSKDEIQIINRIGTNYNSIRSENTSNMVITQAQAQGSAHKQKNHLSVDKQSYSPFKKSMTNSKLNNSISVVNNIKINATSLINRKECSPAENYDIDKMLGEGSYGEVYRVRHKTLNIIRAMKKIMRKQRGIENEIEVLNEINLLKSIDHPNIVKLVEFYITKNSYFIITELCGGGELFDKILENEKFDEDHSAYLMFQILSAVFNCHNKNIVHRDLKPENILVDREEENGYLTIKIIDFGTAKIFEKDKAEQKVIGSAYYIAPEVLDKNYNEKCDLWSCGVILFILLTGKPPFGGSEDEIIKKIRKGIYDENELKKNSSEVKNLIKRLLEMDPNKRLSADEAIKHEWFEKTKTREKIINMSQEKIFEFVRKLTLFKYQSKFQETALAFLVHNSLHLDEVKDIYKVFNAIDLNCDGKINEYEMTEALKKLYSGKKSEEEIKSQIKLIFKNIDNDGNGSIEYEEFVRAVIGKDKLLSDAFVKHTFNFFDKDGSGEITLEEMKGIFGNDIDITTIKKMVQEIDSDGNQEINYEEFKNMLEKLLKNQ